MIDLIAAYVQRLAPSRPGLTIETSAGGASDKAALLEAAGSVAALGPGSAASRSYTQIAAIAPLTRSSSLTKDRIGLKPRPRPLEAAGQRQHRFIRSAGPLSCTRLRHRR